MSNERTAVMTERQPGMVAAHQPGQGGFKSVLPEDINCKSFAALPLRPSGCHRRSALGGWLLHDQGPSTPRG